MNDVQARLGTRIKELRSLKGWTQETLGERAGLSYKFIGEVERGTGNPTVTSVAQIAKALDLDIVELFRAANVTVHYPSFTAADAATVRDARHTVDSLDELLTRLATAARRPQRARRKTR